MAGLARTQILIAAVLFGTTGTAQALLGGNAEPVAVGAARILVGAAFLILFVALAAADRRIGGGPAKILLAGACVAVYQLSFFAAVADTGVAVGTVVAIGSAPAFAGLLGRAVNGEALTGRWVAATVTALAGVCLLLLGGGTAGEVSAPGVGLALAAGAGYAGYAVIAKGMLAAGGRPEALMAAVFGTGAVLLLPVLAFVPAGELAAPSGVVLVLYLGLVPTAMAYILFGRGLEKTSAGETATLTLAEPLTAAALGVIALGERPGPTALAGAALVMAGLALLALRPRAEAKAGRADSVPGAPEAEPAPPRTGPARPALEGRA